MDDAITVKHLNKLYYLYRGKPALVKSFWCGNKREDFWALRDVSLEVAKGEMLGLIGGNGSGKSTLLKIIGGITAPTSGEVLVSGKVASLLELGAGFHYELTGRENVYLNGSIMGMTSREIEEKFSSIVEFSGIGAFIDAPVKNYSSGMFLRLGFAVAVHLEPDILLIDEVLAVGDISFQQKCLDKIAELRRKKVTIVLVSHNLDQVSELCDRVVWLDGGRLKMLGSASSVVRAMVEAN